ncbi:oxygen-dependent coproporphyrinogen oxidase, partial [Alphaproteobacteria bacterium]|nr:oxygen-dependent coproporphyrinogen oxidase [Alphaproteobacteria bacterium]
DEICISFEKIEKNQANSNPNIKFHKKKWERGGGGGGVISVMKGDVFEKVGVNISTVHGEFSQEFRGQIPGAEENGKFWASGISVVSHMCNPYVPAAHMNTRFLVTGEGDKKKIWFGGGGDLTPIFKDENASKLFHKNFKSSCEKYNTNYYPRFKKWCDEYFYLPHRNEARGIGGVFFDYLNSDNWDNDLSFVKDIGKTFLTSYLEIINRRLHKKFTEIDREEQLLRRGRYVEFNLLYDRGTIFGLKTGGNTEAVLMSLPPKVSWT